MFLPEMVLPDSIEVATEIDAQADLAVLAVPSHAMRAITRAFRFNPGTILASVAKGIENDTLLRMSEVIEEEADDHPIVALSGPSHAEEVSRDLPASLVAAGDDSEAVRTVQHVFMADSFRVYTSDDIIGVELGGALKNVIAIAAGVCDGLGLGDNAKAALMTRGLAEMARLGEVMGANPMTFAGLSGMGDLIVTCTSQHSRNRAVGERLARGMTTEQAVSASPMVAEGVVTARSAHGLAQELDVDMPITEHVYRALFEGLSPREAVTTLMTRDAKPELR